LATVAASSTVRRKRPDSSTAKAHFGRASLFALRWNDWDPHNPDHLRIDEAFGKCGLHDPKTPRSDSYVYLPSGVQALLLEWKAWCGDSRPGAFIFASKRDTPMRYDNYLKRVLQPAAEAVGLESITHQMLRRSFSTMALDSGASPKDVQGKCSTLRLGCPSITAR